MSTEESKANKKKPPITAATIDLFEGKGKPRTLSYTPILKLFIAYLQNCCGIKGEEISAHFGHQPSWFSDLKTGKRKQVLANELAEIIAFGYNCENSRNDENFQKINCSDAGYFNLDVDNTIKFSDYTRYRVEDFISTITDPKTGKLKMDIKNELWMLVLLFEYDLIALDGPHKIRTLINQKLPTSDPKKLFTLLGDNEYLPNRYKTKYFIDEETGKKLKESISITKNNIYVEKGKNEHDFPLIFINYDLISTDEYKKQHGTDTKRLPDGCKAFDLRVALYEKGRIRLIDLFMLLRYANYLPCHSEEYLVFERTLIQLYERTITTFYTTSEWVKAPEFPAHTFQIYDFDNMLNSGIPAFFGLIDFFEKIDIPENDVEFTLFKNNFLKLKRTYMKTISFDFSFIESLTTIQTTRLYKRLSQLIEDFKKNPDEL